MAVLVNAAKTGLFEVDERIEMLREVTAGSANVRVDSFQGLLVDYCRDRDIPVVVKGLRAVSDFDYELQMAQMNNRLTGVETCSCATNPEYSFLSSSLVKEVATWGGDVSGLVPDAGAAPGCAARLGPTCRPLRPTVTDPTLRTAARGRAREARRADRRSSRTPAPCRCRPPASSTGARCSACSRRSGRCCRRSSGTPSCCWPTASRSSTRAAGRRRGIISRGRGRSGSP